MRRFARGPFAILVITMALGFVAIRLAIWASLSHPFMVLDTQSLSDIQKRVLDERESMSKWLMGVAYSTLAFLFGVRVKEQTGSLKIRSNLPMVSCALLVLSIYGGFQFQSETIWALSVSTALISSPLVKGPLNIQL